MSLPGYDEWKNRSPDDEYIPPDERPEGCECNRRLGDNKWCAVHGKDPDAAYENGIAPRRKGETACLSAVATNEPCLPDSTLKRCTICGFIVDTQYAAELPPRNAAASAQSETKEPSAKPAAAGDLERARALLADDPDEMDEEWLAGIITAIRAEARAEGATDGFQTTPRKTISG